MKTIFILTSSNHNCSENSLGSYHSLVSGLKLNNVKIKTTSTCKLLDSEDEVISEENIIQTGKDPEIDLIILMYVNIPFTDSWKDFYKEPYLSKALDINLWYKTIFIDYYERTWRNVDCEQPSIHKFIISKCHKYFKREMFKMYTFWYNNILPYPLSYFPPNYIDKLPEKTRDIFCSFPQLRTGLRLEVIDLCSRLKREFNILIKNDCNQEEYIKNIRSSWITLDSKGAGEVNNRFFEIISNRSLCMRQKYNIVFYKEYKSSYINNPNFTGFGTKNRIKNTGENTGENMIEEYDSIEELEEKLRYLLKNKKQIIEMEERAYKHYNTFHTSDKVVKYLLEESKI
jgi:hypothetical protein